MTIEIADLPAENGNFPYCERLPEGEPCEKSPVTQGPPPFYNSKTPTAQGPSWRCAAVGHHFMGRAAVRPEQAQRVETGQDVLGPGRSAMGSHGKRSPLIFGYWKKVPVASGND